MTHEPVAAEDAAVRYEQLREAAHAVVLDALARGDRSPALRRLVEVLTSE